MLSAAGLESALPTLQQDPYLAVPHDHITILISHADKRRFVLKRQEASAVPLYGAIGQLESLQYLFVIYDGHDCS